MQLCEGYPTTGLTMQLRFHVPHAHLPACLSAHLQLLRKCEGHLRTVAGERDAALEQLQLAEVCMEEGQRRLKEAQRKEVRMRLLCRLLSRVLDCLFHGLPRDPAVHRCPPAYSSAGIQRTAAGRLGRPAGRGGRGGAAPAGAAAGAGGEGPCNGEPRKAAIGAVSATRHRIPSAQALHS